MSKEVVIKFRNDWEYWAKWTLIYMGIGETFEWDGWFCLEQNNWNSGKNKTPLMVGEKAYLNHREFKAGTAIGIIIMYEDITIWRATGKQVECFSGRDKAELEFVTEVPICWVVEAFLPQ